MKYFNLPKEKLSSLWPMWFLIMLLATWSIYIQDGQINRDGLLYLKQAYLIGEGDWNEGLAVYPWPFFSILIAVFHKITNLNLQVVAHGLDLILFGIATLFYLKTLKLIYKKKENIFYGGIILLSFIPIMDDYIGMVLRDHGLWAGCMIGTYFFFKNLIEYSFKNSIYWQSGFLLAGLFRPEGLVILVLLPLWNLFHNKTQFFKKLVQDYSLNILFVILGLSAIFLSNYDFFDLINSSRLTEFLNRPILFFNQLVSPLPLQTDNQHLSILLEDYSLVITYSFLLTILIFKWVKGLGLLHGGLFLYSIFLKKKTTDIFQKHNYFFLAVSFILVSVNLFNVYVLTSRYWVFHWWWILILITPVTLIIFEDRRVSSYIKNILSVTLTFFILNSMSDKNENLEQQIALYIKDSQLIQQIDFHGNDRIKYYVNYSVHDLIKKDNNQSSPVYEIYKIDNKKNYNQISIIKNFPETKPKYILIENVK